MQQTYFYYDEKVFWHTTRDSVLYLPASGYLQPLTSLGHVENAETKRRFLSLVHVSGLMQHLDSPAAQPVLRSEAELIHSPSYLDQLEKLSQTGGGEVAGGEMGEDVTFGYHAYHYALLSAGLAKDALLSVVQSQNVNAYALTRPPGHHSKSDQGIGFGLLSNISIAIECAKQQYPDLKVAVVDWDVHHGNGTEACFYDRQDVLTISLHQEDLFPRNSGHIKNRGEGEGYGYNINVPLPAGTGHDGYMYAIHTIVIPALQKFQPDVIVIASGYDAGFTDPLGRMMLTTKTFACMTQCLMDIAKDLCQSRIAVTHEGGYCPAYSPLCAYSVLETLSGQSMNVDDAFTSSWENLVGMELLPHQKARIDEIATII